MIIYMFTVLSYIMYIMSRVPTLAELTSVKIMKQLKCPKSSTKCQETNQTSAYSRHFELNGHKLDFWNYYHDGIAFDCHSNSFAVDDTSFPKLENEIFIPKLVIFDCIPPKNSYVGAIRDWNITYESLYIVFSRLDDNLSFNTKSFKGLNFLKEFSFEVRDFRKNYFDLNLLNSLPPMVSLELVGLILPQFPTWNKFENILIRNTSPLNISPWENCDFLRNLTIQEYHVRILPDGWLAKCTQLEELRIETIQELKRLPNRMLDVKNSLKSLTIKKCNIEELPTDFTSYTKNLRFLDLSHNMLNFASNFSNVELSSLTHLEVFDISLNNIELEYLEHLRPPTTLKYLNLASNYWVGVCQDRLGKETHWPQLPSLTFLSLHDTGFIKPCPEWREAMPALKEVDVSYSSIISTLNLTFDDIKLIRNNNWEIDARDNIVDIIYSEADYRTVLLEDYNQSQAIMHLSFPIECNCKWYWFIKVIKEKPNHISMPGFTCVEHWGDHTSKSLDEINPENIKCVIDTCPTDCECFKFARSELVLANCTNTKLDKVPNIINVKELLLSNNTISILRSEDLLDTLQYVDLRNNLLKVITSEVAKTLFSVPLRKMSLSGNSFICHCDNKMFLELMHSHKNQVLDFNNITCIDGLNSIPIGTVDLQNLCTNTTANITLILVSCIIILIMFGGFIFYIYSRKINSCFIKYGFNIVNEESSDVNKIYDAFISYAYEDTWFITDELMPVLEEKNGFKLCVHTRDWMAGDWIPSQIARSVQNSRRTVIILSKNFLSSIWALLEFRTAHIQTVRDKQTRVIIILLEELTSQMKMDVEMQNYLATNTYIKWGETNFWDKLRKALECRSNEEQIIEAGEEVVRLLTSNDPPIKLRTICDNLSDNGEIEKNTSS